MCFPVIVFLDRGCPCFWNFYSAVSVGVVGIESLCELNLSLWQTRSSPFLKVAVC